MLSDDVRQALLSRPEFKAKQKRERTHFCCPRHEDREPSAWMVGGAWGCFACGFDESITSLAQELGIHLEGSGGYTLERYADEKAFPANALRDFGLSTATVNGREVVRIPYFDKEGNELRARFRSPTGKWWEGRNRPIYPYGMDRLPDLGEGAAIVVVEGESDCHAAWIRGVAAFGLPGATSWKSEWAELLNGLDVYLWEEPDQGGAQFAQKVAADLPDAKVISGAGVKDLADLYRKSGEGFADSVRELMATATKLGTPKPPVVFDAFLGRHIDDLLQHKLQPVDAVPTPFPQWNGACADEGGRIGVARGWHITAAARTGSGKSVLALNLAAKAINVGERVCFVSLEMSQPQLETRLMSIASGVPIRKLEQGRDFDRASFRQAGTEFSRIHQVHGGIFYANRDPVYNLAGVADSIIYNHEVHGCRFFVVDYLQLAGNPNDPESITEVSHLVRKLAHDLRVVTIGLSQFNRSTSALRNERPSVQGLMGGSALENDSDQVLLVDHSRTDRAPPPAEGWTSYLLLAKNRHGPELDIPMGFDQRTLRMRELMPDEIPAQEVA